MAEFKQIIGRGTRVRDDYGKHFFNILDFTGSATRQFADPEFDGEPALIDQTTLDAAGAVTNVEVEEEAHPLEARRGRRRLSAGRLPRQLALEHDGDGAAPRKYYVDGGSVAIIAATGLRVSTPPASTQRIVQYTDYTADAVRTLYPSAALLRSHWADAAAREQHHPAAGRPGHRLRACWRR